MGMKRIFLTLLLCAGLGPVWGVEIDTDKVLDTVMKVGVKLLEKEAQKLEGDMQMDPDSRKIASGVVNLSAQILEKERQEHQRGMDEALKAQGVQPAMQPVPQNGANAVSPLQPLPDPLGATVQAVEEIGAHILNQAVGGGVAPAAGVGELREEVLRGQQELREDLLLEQQKLAEGLTARVQQQGAENERLQASVQTMQWVCWCMLAAVIVLLALVAGMFWYIRGGKGK